MYIELLLFVFYILDISMIIIFIIVKRSFFSVFHKKFVEWCSMPVVDGPYKNGIDA